MSNKIKGLILYEAQRHRECYKTSVKHGLVPSKINYSMFRGAPQRRKCLGRIHNHHQIKSLSCSLSSFEDNQKLISLASALTNLKNLCIRLGAINLDVFRKGIKRLFLRKKRLREIKLILIGGCAEGSFPWRALEKLRCLTSLKISIEFNSLSVLESWHNFLKRNNHKKRNLFPSLKSQSILLNFTYSHMESLLDDFLDPFSGSSSFEFIWKVFGKLEAQAKRYSPCKFSFNLSNIFSLDQFESKRICSILTDLQSLSILSLEGGLEDIRRVLQFLPKDLTKLEASKKLRLLIRSDRINSSLDLFLTELREFSHLQCLSLNLVGSKGMMINSSLIMTLRDSLGMMVNLRDLTILCEKLAFSSGSMESLFEGLGECVGLESLCLNISNSSESLKRETFMDMCTSLQNLKNLRTIKLDISFGSIDIDEEAIEVWDTMLKSLSGVMDFSLNLIDFETAFEAKMLSRFIQTFGSLRGVSTLTLVLHFWDLEPELYLILAKLLYKLKSLDSFILRLLAQDWTGASDDNVKALKSLQEKFSYKAFLLFTIAQDL